MKISFNISQRVDANGMAEVKLRTVRRIDGRLQTMCADSSVRIDPAFFSPVVGIDLSKKRLIRPDVKKYHLEAMERLNAIISAVATAESAGGSDTEFSRDWLRQTVDNYLHPKQSEQERAATQSVYDLAEDYLQRKQFSEPHAKSFRVLMRAVARYEGFMRAKDSRRQDYVFDVNTVCRDDIEDFMDYLREEKRLSEQYPRLFAKLTHDYPANLNKGYKTIQGRGDNATIKLMDMLKAFFHWLYDTERTRNRPFDGVRMKGEKYGTPYYITIEERNKIAVAPMPSKHLETQRDIFVFQCLIGCRVSDLMRLTPDNITDDGRGAILTYAPHKTKDEGEQSRLAVVPLIAEAQALIRKYKGKDVGGRLMPCISAQKYNDAIKEVFRLAGVTRSVTVRNPQTGENEQRPINEVASSHLARRTFVGNIYHQTPDPNIIGKMSGHVEGSRAFSRYRTIEADTLRSVVEKLK